MEIRNYQGENLSSVNDFRENSIKGVQHVDPGAQRHRFWMQYAKAVAATA